MQPIGATAEILLPNTLNKRTGLMLLAPAFLWGCMSMPVEPLARPAGGTSAELLVYRVSSFAAGGVTAAVGTAGQAFAHLDNGEYLIAQMAPGERDIFIRARSAAPNTLRLSLRPGERVCVRVVADIGALATSMSTSSLTSTGYRFQAHVVHCPTAAGLAAYAPVQIRYADAVSPR